MNGTHTKIPQSPESGQSTGIPADPGIHAVARLEQQSQNARSRLDQLSDWITRKAGSAAAILLHAVWFAMWLVANLHALPGIPVFDPFPFSFLTMIVSLEAIFLTLFVLVSQNRMSHEADKRAHLDLQVNILAERESTRMLQMLTAISEELGIQKCAQGDLADLTKETKIEELSKKLEGALPSQ